MAGIYNSHLPRKSHQLQKTPMKTLLTEEQLRVGIGRMAGEIQKNFDGKHLTIVGVLMGSIVLLADLIRLLNQPLRVDMVQASSYRGEIRPGPLRIDVELLSTDIKGRDVLLVDDISTPATPSGK